MFTLNVDLGQVILAGLITVIGYLVNNSVSRIYQTLDRHDELIVQIIAKIGIEPNHHGKRR